MIKEGKGLTPTVTTPQALLTLSGMNPTDVLGMSETTKMRYSSDDLPATAFVEV